MLEVRIRQALLSVSDKTGVVEFAKGLAVFGIEIISTGGTAKVLREAGLKVTDVSEVTGFPEMLDGRVKTLHPKIHAAILAVRSNPQHVEALRAQGIELIDLVAVNFYQFGVGSSGSGKQVTNHEPRTTNHEPRTTNHEIEQIDIGGPTLVRAAAKNFESVTVIVDPNDYAVVLEEMQRNGGSTSLELRRKLAAKAFAHTASYDAAISGWFSKQLGELFPETLALAWHKKLDLRYGENPHQKAAFYVEPNIRFPCVAGATWLHGKELSFNNIADLDAAWELVSEFDEPAACIIKHTNPCGVAVDSTLAKAFAKARDSDPEARFGGIIGLNQTVDVATANEILVQGSFYEAIIAPGYEDEALAMIKARKGWGETIRLLATKHETRNKKQELQLKSVGGGLLVQTKDTHLLNQNELQVVTKRKPTDAELKDLLFAWKVVKHVKSNAILLAKEGVTVGVGGGQMNRAVSTKLAIELAGERAKGAVLASDAFFPFADGPEAAAKAGVTAIIQPGGSRRDKEVIEVCDRYGMAMVFTGLRHFRH